MANRQRSAERSSSDDRAPIIAPEGWVIVAGFLAGAVALTWFATWGFGAIAGWMTGIVSGALALWCTWFFRDPPRCAPGPENGKRPVVCPADGVVCAIARALPPTELGVPFDQSSRMTRVSVFMNIFNVHVNRAPVDGTILAVRHNPGKFFNASFDKASEHNERLGIRLRLPPPDGREMACVQVAGLIARRIVCRVNEGSELRAGERYGIIKFGSRVDVYLPGGVAPMVKVGEKVIAGETVFGWLEPATQSGGRGAAAGNHAGASSGVRPPRGFTLAGPVTRPESGAGEREVNDVHP